MTAKPYNRPNLWPFDYGTMPDFSANPGIALGGTTAQALQLITQITSMEVSVAWDVFFPQFDPAYNYSASYNKTVNLDSPGAPPASAFQSSVGYYYKDTNGDRWANPAERVLISPPDSADPWPSLSTAYGLAFTQSLNVQMRVTRTSGGLVQSCLDINANDVSYGMSASLNNPGSVTLATIPLLLPVYQNNIVVFTVSYGTFYLNVNAVPPLIPSPVVNLFSASASVTLYDS